MSPLRGLGSGLVGRGVGRGREGSAVVVWVPLSSTKLRMKVKRRRFEGLGFSCKYIDQRLRGNDREKMSWKVCRPAGRVVVVTRCRGGAPETWNTLFEAAKTSLTSINPNYPTRNSEQRLRERETQGKRERGGKRAGRGRIRKETMEGPRGKSRDPEVASRKRDHLLFLLPLDCMS